MAYQQNNAKVLGERSVLYALSPTTTESVLEAPDHSSQQEPLVLI